MEGISGSFSRLRNRKEQNDLRLFVQATEEADTEENDFGSPLWVPHWPTFDPAVGECADPEIFGDGLEGKYVLQHIMGHNLCLDVFGDHSPGEVRCGPRA